jgi:putative copper resistance protein D
MDLAGALALGSALLSGWVLDAEADRRRALNGSAVLAGVWTLLQVLNLLGSYAVATGQSPTDHRFGSDLAVYLATDLGIWTVTGVILAAITTTLAFTGTSRSLARVVAVGIALGLGAKAMTGHASGTASHEVATSTMLLHLLAMGVWVGGLAVLQVLPRTSRDDANVIRRYSHLALISWITLALSGVWALAVRMNSPADLLTSDYVHLGLAKAVLLLVLGFIGAQQRRLLADRAADMFAPYRRLALLELVLMTIAVALAAAMSSSPPPANDSPATGSAAELLTGYVLPSAPGPGSLVTAWRPDPFMIALAAFVLLGWFRRGRLARAERSGAADAEGSRRNAVGRADTEGSRGNAVGRADARVFAGLAVLLWLTCGVLAVYAPVLFSAHVMQHALMLLVAGPFLAGAWGIPAPLRSLSREVPWVVAVLAAVPVALVALVYVRPELITLVLETHPGHLAFLLGSVTCGVFGRWFLVLAWERGGVVRVLGAALPAAVLVAAGVVLTAGDVLVASDWFGATGRTWRADALADQRFGGVLLLAVTGVVAAACVVGRILAGRRDVGESTARSAPDR